MKDLPDPSQLRQLPTETSTADEYESLEDKFPLRAARGAVIGLVLGTFIWLVILVLVFGILSPSVLLIASLMILIVIALKSLRRAHGTAQVRSKIVDGTTPRKGCLSAPTANKSSRGGVSPAAAPADRS